MPNDTKALRRTHLYRVPVTLAESRRVEVRAASATEARERVEAGRYERLGPKGERGFLSVGEPERVSNA